MKFHFNDKVYNFPTCLRDITLKQRIEFDNLYGKEIEETHKTIYKANEDGSVEVLDEMEATLFQLDIACKNFSFFSGIPLDDVRKLPMDQVLNVYHSCFAEILKEEQEIKLLDKYYWNDELWVLETPEINHESKMSFNEFVTAKQIVKTMHDLGSGQWDSLPSLCAIFLRKENEPFDEKFISGTTNRSKEMLELPLDIALCVAFFLQISMSMYSKIIQSSNSDQKEEKVPA